MKYTVYQVSVEYSKDDDQVIISQDSAFGDDSIIAIDTMQVDLLIAMLELVKDEYLSRGE